MVEFIESRSDKGTHILQILVYLKTRTIAAHDSVPMEVTARLRKMMVLDQSHFADEIPLTLKPQHEYSASADFKTVGFEIASFGTGIKASKPLKENVVQRWNWILTPKDGKQGGVQFTAVDFFVYDDKAKDLVWNGPVARLTLVVGTPLGLPNWLVSTQFVLTSLISGLATLFVPWLLQTYGPKRKEHSSESKD